MLFSARESVKNAPYFIRILSVWTFFLSKKNIKAYDIYESEEFFEELLTLLNLVSVSTNIFKTIFLLFACHLWLSSWLVFFILIKILSMSDKISENTKRKRQTPSIYQLHLKISTWGTKNLYQWNLAKFCQRATCTW